MWPGMYGTERQLVEYLFLYSRHYAIVAHEVQCKKKCYIIFIDKFVRKIYLNVSMANKLVPIKFIIIYSNKVKIKGRL